MFDSIHEECGVFGIFENSSADVAASTYFGLYDDSNVYKPGYHRALTSSFVLPEGTT